MASLFVSNDTLLTALLVLGIVALIIWILKSLRG